METWREILTIMTDRKLMKEISETDADRKAGYLGVDGILFFHCMGFCSKHSIEQEEFCSIVI
jgi:hypothetical protein